MKYLLDTSAVSEPVRAKPDERVIGWLREREESALFLSVLTLGELHKGIAGLPEGARRNQLRNWVDEALARRFEGRILDVGLDIASEWGRLQAEARRRGQPLPVVGSLIAATAIVHHLTVVTRNAQDFTRCGAAVYDPWTAKT